VIISCPRNAIIVVVALALLVLVGCGEMDAEADPRLQLGSEPVGQILFVKAGDIHLWDGSIDQLTDFGDASSPAWSPNGEQYLFIRTGDAYSTLMLGNAQNRQWRDLTESEPSGVPGTEEYLRQATWYLDPAWSPTGNGIAYITDRGSDKNFLWYQSGVDSGDEWRVPCSTRENDNVERPHFSPDGSQVVFAQRTSSREDFYRWMELRVCDLNTDEIIELTEGSAEDSAFFPRWSPDGEWIAFVRRVDGRSDIWIVPAGGGDPIRVTEEGDVTAPEWSPDGQFLAFLDQDGSNFRVAYIEIEIGSDGSVDVSDRQGLFSESNIDATSGISWSD
jgi:TolB protein